MFLSFSIKVEFKTYFVKVFLEDQIKSLAVLIGTLQNDTVKVLMGITSSLASKFDEYYLSLINVIDFALVAQ